MSDISCPHDEYFMGIALQHAKRGIGCTFPNPSVGAVIVRDGQIIAVGNTGQGGRPHAETLALAQAGLLSGGATLYVTLEPCSHFGVTAPCADAVISAGISRVVIATRDSDNRVSGRGIQKLEAAGISVTYGVREAEARALNAGFFSRIEQHRPYITLKLATTLDGKIATATGKSNWITGETSRKYAHLLRAQNDAIMVGINTVLCDNPTLTCRLPGLENRSPIRIIADSTLRFPLDTALIHTLTTAPLWIVTCRHDARQHRMEALRALGVKVIELDPDSQGRIDIIQAMALLAKEGITRLLIEGGGTLAASCMKAECVDSLIWMRAPMVLGSEAIASVGGLNIQELVDASRWKREQVTLLGEDMLEKYSPMPG